MLLSYGQRTREAWREALTRVAFRKQPEGTALHRERGKADPQRASARCTSNHGRGGPTTRERGKAGAVNRVRRCTCTGDGRSERCALGVLHQALTREGRGTTERQGLDRTAAR